MVSGLGRRAPVRRKYEMSKKQVLTLADVYQTHGALDLVMGARECDLVDSARACGLPALLESAVTRVTSVLPDGSAVTYVSGFNTKDPEYQAQQRAYIALAMPLRLAYEPKGIDYTPATLSTADWKAYKGDDKEALTPVRKRIQNTPMVRSRRLFAQMFGADSKGEFPIPEGVESESDGKETTWAQYVTGQVKPMKSEKRDSMRAVAGITPADIDLGANIQTYGMAQALADAGWVKSK